MASKKTGDEEVTSPRRLTRSMAAQKRRNESGEEGSETGERRFKKPRIPTGEVHTSEREQPEQEERDESGGAGASLIRSLTHVRWSLHGENKMPRDDQGKATLVRKALDMGRVHRPNRERSGPSITQDVKLLYEHGAQGGLTEGATTSEDLSPAKKISQQDNTARKALDVDFNIEEHLVGRPGLPINSSEPKNRELQLRSDTTSTEQWPQWREDENSGGSWPCRQDDSSNSTWPDLHDNYSRESWRSGGSTSQQGIDFSLWMEEQGRDLFGEPFYGNNSPSNNAEPNKEPDHEQSGSP